MDRRQITLKLVLDQLEAPCKVNDFDDRLAIQKAIYLVQAAGVELGYHFQWYLRGPYAPSLAKNAHAACAELGTSNDESKGWRLEDEFAKKLHELRPLVKPESESNVSARRLELLASVHYLVDKGVAEQDPAVLKATLEKYEKNFEENEIIDALEELNDYGLFQQGSQ